MHPLARRRHQRLRRMQQDRLHAVQGMQGRRHRGPCDDDDQERAVVGHAARHSAPAPLGVPDCRPEAASACPLWAVVMAAVSRGQSRGFSKLWAGIKGVAAVSEHALGHGAKCVIRGIKAQSPGGAESSSTGLAAF